MFSTAHESEGQRQPSGHQEQQAGQRGCIEQHLSERCHNVSGPRLFSVAAGRPKAPASGIHGSQRKNGASDAKSRLAL